MENLCKGTAGCASQNRELGLFQGGVAFSANTFAKGASIGKAQPGRAMHGGAGEGPGSREAAPRRAGGAPGPRGGSDPRGGPARRSRQWQAGRQAGSGQEKEPRAGGRAGVRAGAAGPTCIELQLVAGQRLQRQLVALEAGIQQGSLHPQGAIGRLHRGRGERGEGINKALVESSARRSWNPGWEAAWFPSQRPPRRRGASGKCSAQEQAASVACWEV